MCNKHLERLNPEAAQEIKTLKEDKIDAIYLLKKKNTIENFLKYIEINEKLNSLVKQ